MNDNFENERNQFFWTVFRTVKERNENSNVPISTLCFVTWQPLIRVQYPPSDPPPPHLTNEEHFSMLEINLLVQSSATA